MDEKQPRLQTTFIGNCYRCGNNLVVRCSILTVSLYMFVSDENKVLQNDGGSFTLCNDCDMQLRNFLLQRKVD